LKFILKLCIALRMTPAAFNAFCNSMPHATYVCQWGGADVWKIGGKVFAIYFPPPDKYAGITFKTSAISFEMLKMQEGLRPAPYFASRGMKWIQRFEDVSMNDTDLKKYLAESYRLVFAGLTKAMKATLC
jgi:predicted DNA-binding protein (MmcQ/YjbR family)